jgi:deazaflavin-dependent oxidoreductase (nitroreductase family)
LAGKEFLEALNSTVEVELTVKGRRSGQSSSRPVWFVLDGETIYLLPMYGFKTEWYQNLLANPEVALSAGGKKMTAHAKPIHESAKFAEVVDRFRRKHGADEIEKYYVKLETAVAVPL